MTTLADDYKSLISSLSDYLKEESQEGLRHEYTDPNTFEAFKNHFQSKKAKTTPLQKPPAPLAKLRSIPAPIRKKKPFQVPTSPITQKETPKPSTPLPSRKPSSSKQDPLDETPLRQFFEKRFPQVSIGEKPLDDATAKVVSEEWKNKKVCEEAIFLCRSEEDTKEIFYQKIAQALEKRGIKASVCEANAWKRENGWGKLLEEEKALFVITSITLLEELPFLSDTKKTLFTPFPIGASLGIALPHSLSECQLIPNKKALWQTLCYHFSIK